MSKLRTCYDLLRVTRDAPPEVIRAAYRALCLKYHPDRNQDDPTAERIMADINAAYAILADPAKRAEHDAWIARCEAEDKTLRAASAEGAPPRRASARRASARGASAGDAERPAAAARQDVRGDVFGGAGGRFSARYSSASARSRRPRRPSAGSRFVELVKRGRWFYLLIAAALVWKFLSFGGTKRPDQPVEPAVEQQAVKPLPLRPAAKAVADAPKPDAAAAAEAANATVAGAANATQPAPQAAGNGVSNKPAGPGAKTAARCRVVLDNRQGAALTGRLVRKGKAGTKVVREFSIPARGVMTVRNVPPGTYEVQYGDPAGGRSGKTDVFTLREAAEADGVHADSLTFTIVEGAKGSLRTAPVGVVEF